VDSYSAVTTAATDDDSCASATAGVPRKHKKIHRTAAAVAAAAAVSNDSSLSTEGQVPLAPVHPYRKPANPYVAYRNIKMKVNGWHCWLKIICCLMDCMLGMSIYAVKKLLTHSLQQCLGSCFFTVRDIFIFSLFYHYSTSFAGTEWPNKC